jgi:predicted RecB family nuclease
MRRSFIFPTRGYGLKRLGGFLGYPFSNPHLDGLTVSTQYQDHIERGDPLDPRDFVYNEDDVKVLPYIESWARERVRR